MNNKTLDGQNSVATSLIEMEEEVWRPVAGYEGLYEASNIGRVKSLAKTDKFGRLFSERIMKPGRNKQGYLRVGLTRDGNRKYFQVHRIIWEAFNGPIPDGYVVNHLNEKVDDCRLENLNLMTPKENTNWGTGIQRRAKSQSKPVVQYTLEGVYIRTWPSLISVEKEFGHLGFDERCISRCCLGKQKTHKGYIWKFSEIS